ncbi:hypothetical protein BKA56DRAFT_505462, partial [Ilyonectria sp. MPI-CAGE-AT-0026]
VSSRGLWLKVSLSIKHRNRAANATTWKLLRSHGRRRFRVCSYSSQHSRPGARQTLKEWKKSFLVALNLYVTERFVIRPSRDQSPYLELR